MFGRVGPWRQGSHAEPFGARSLDSWQTYVRAAESVVLPGVKFSTSTKTTRLPPTRLPRGIRIRTVRAGAERPFGTRPGRGRRGALPPTVRHGPCAAPPRASKEACSYALMRRVSRCALSSPAAAPCFLPDSAAVRGCLGLRQVGSPAAIAQGRQDLSW